jgi:hypothetical protein
MTKKDKTQGRHKVTLSEMEQIAALKDPILRNLKITLAYHDITLAMADLVGPENLTWSAFGCWASKTAGLFVRGDEAPRFLRTFIENTQRILADKRLLAPLTMLPRDFSLEPILNIVARKALDGVGQEVARGNQMVFEEIGRLFVRFLETFHGDKTPEPAKLSRFIGSLTPGPVEKDGQDYLIKAFTNYYEAMFEPDPRKKAQLVHLGNAYTGYHEQTRLQPRIQGGLHAPIEILLIEAFRVNIKNAAIAKMSGKLEDTIAARIVPAAKAVEEEFRRLNTRWVMRLTLPSAVLDLGHDVPALASGKMFPDDLSTIDHQELAAILYQLDLSPNTLVGTAAKDWGSLSDRMHFVIDMMRSRQQDQSLKDEPFTPAQIKIIRGGGVPEGDL